LFAGNFRLDRSQTEFLHVGFYFSAFLLFWAVMARKQHVHCAVYHVMNPGDCWGNIFLEGNPTDQLHEFGADYSYATSKAYDTDARLSTTPLFDICRQVVRRKKLDAKETALECAKGGWKRNVN
jgi:hypothetical protein